MQYLIIFLVKLLEVTLGTIRVMMLTRGYRRIATILIMIENTLWLLVTSSVLLGLQADPFKGIVYVLAVTTGVYVGSCIESRLALGLVEIGVITGIEMGNSMSLDLRNAGYGVTATRCEGLEGAKQRLDILIHRKDVNKTLRLIREYDSVFVSIRDINTVPIGAVYRRIF